MSYPDENGGTAAQTDETTNAPATQTEAANISTLADSNGQAASASSSGNANTGSEVWRGDKRYFQEGKKAGTLKPQFRPIGNKPREIAGGGGIATPKLDASALRATAPVNKPAEEKKAAQTKAEKKAGEARIGAAMAMRFLDMLTDFISAGTFGQDFDKEKTEARNKYREELEGNWRTYLETLDIPMHPGLVVALGSAMYVAPAFNTAKGAERAETFKSKIIGWTIGRIFK